MGLQLTRGGEYAIRAMACLASSPQGSAVSLHAISCSRDIPECFLAKILQCLVRAGFVASRRGASGGFLLVRPPCEISLRDILEAVDGPLCLNQCILWPEECTRSHTCRLREVWVRAQAQLAELLTEVTLDQLVDEEPSSSCSGEGNQPAYPFGCAGEGH